MVGIGRQAEFGIIPYLVARHTNGINSSKTLIIQRIFQLNFGIGIVIEQKCRSHFDIRKIGGIKTDLVIIFVCEILPVYRCRTAFVTTGGHLRLVQPAGGSTLGIAKDQCRSTVAFGSKIGRTTAVTGAIKIPACNKIYCTVIGSQLVITGHIQHQLAVGFARTPIVESQDFVSRGFEAHLCSFFVTKGIVDNCACGRSCKHVIVGTTLHSQKQAVSIQFVKNGNQVGIGRNGMHIRIVFRQDGTLPVFPMAESITKSFVGGQRDFGTLVKSVSRRAQRNVAGCCG